MPPPKLPDALAAGFSEVTNPKIPGISYMAYYGSQEGIMRWIERLLGQGSTVMPITREQFLAGDRTADSRFCEDFGDSIFIGSYSRPI